MLKPKGVEVDYYDPTVGAGIASLIKPNTKVVYLESPGSLTFEMQDIPAIAAEAHKAGAPVIIDNTWASPLFLKPFTLGVDVSIQAATKYIVGHSDAMLGTVTTTEAAWLPLRNAAGTLGQCGGPDDIYLGLRGLRTLDVRLRHTRPTPSSSHTGWKPARKSPTSSTPPCRAIPATTSGSATSSARAAFSASS